MLQVNQLDVQQGPLYFRRSQGRIRGLTGGDLLRPRRRTQPQQHLGEVVQQRRLVDDGGVMVPSVRGETHREGCSTVRPLQHVVESFERAWVPGQPVLCHRLAAELPEEGPDAHHDERGGDGLHLAPRAFPPAVARHRCHVRKQLQGHQWIAHQGLREQMGIYIVFVFAPFLDRLGRLGEHRQTLRIEQCHPTRHIGRSSGQEGRRRIHKKTLDDRLSAIVNPG